MYKKVRGWTDRRGNMLIIASLLIIMIIYLGCMCILSATAAVVWNTERLIWETLK